MMRRLAGFVICAAVCVAIAALRSMSHTPLIAAPAAPQRPIRARQYRPFGYLTD